MARVGAKVRVRVRVRLKRRARCSVMQYIASENKTGLGSDSRHIDDSL